MKDRTSRSLVFVIYETIKSLRHLAARADDPTVIQLIVKEAEVLSQSVTRLSKRIQELPPEPNAEPIKTDHIPLTMICEMLALAKRAQFSAVCVRCGGFKLHQNSPDIIT